MNRREKDQQLDDREMKAGNRCIWYIYIYICIYHADPRGGFPPFLDL